MIDKIFKIGLLIIGIMFLYLYYQSTETNRFIYTNFGYILDTKTGKLYVFEKEVIRKWIIMDPVGDSISYDKIIKNKSTKELLQGGNP